MWLLVYRYWYWYVKFICVRRHALSVYLSCELTHTCLELKMRIRIKYSLKVGTHCYKVSFIPHQKCTFNLSYQIGFAWRLVFYTQNIILLHKIHKLLPR